MDNYNRFLDDLNDFYKGFKSKISMDDALAVVRDQWIARRMLDELIDFIHINWDSGNCDEFIEPLSNLLLKENDSERFTKLWWTITGYRIKELKNITLKLKRIYKSIDYQELKKIDISGFNMFLPDSYKDLKKATAFQLDFTLKGLEKFKHGLQVLNKPSSVEAINVIIDKVSNFELDSVTMFVNS